MTYYFFELSVAGSGWHRRKLREGKEVDANCTQVGMGVVIGSVIIAIVAGTEVVVAVVTDAGSCCSGNLLVVGSIR